MNKLQCGLMALSCLSYTAFVFGDPGSLNTTGWIAFTVQDFDYAEFFDDGSTADREAGLIPGVNLGVSVTRNRLFAESALSAWSGHVGYHGPVDTVTDEDLLEWNVLAGAEVYRRGAGDIAVYAGAGYRYWERDIQSTTTLSGLFETYEWWYGILGMRTHYQWSESTRLRADIRLLRPLEPEIQVEFAAGFDEKSLDLGEKTGARVALTLEKKLDGKTRYFISPWFEYWELGRSRTEPLLQNGVAVGTVFEPMSEARNVGINIGVTWLP